MAINLVINGITYPFPQTGDASWGDQVDAFATAVTNGMLQKAGGSFPLTADVDFGASFGLKSAYFASRTGNASSTGQVRLSNSDSVSFRNSTNTGDLALKPGSTDGVIAYGGSDLASASGIQTLINKTISGSNNTLTNIPYSALVLAASIVNADIASGAGIAYSKLALAGSIQNSDLAGGIAYSKLSLTGSIQNSDLAAPISLANGGTGQTTQQAAIDALTGTQSAGKYLRSDGTHSSLQTIQTSDVPTLNQNTTGSAASFTGSLAGDVTGTQGATVIAANVVTNTKLAQMAANTLKGNNTGSTANASDLTATQVTAMLNAFVGDSGSGGTKGMVPAPSAGDAAAGKVLTAGGTWGAAGTASPLTTKGDLYGYSTSNQRIPVGSDYQTLVPDSNQTLGVRWANRYQGQKNYITYSDFENGATTGWTLCNVGTLTNGLPTGTSPNFSFASGNLAISVVSSGQLAGTKSLQALMTAASTVGDGVATQAYTIDAEDQAKCLGFRFAYKASANASNANFSGTSSNSFGVAVWDATNSVFIPVAGAFNLVQSSGVGIATGTFQTASNTASIRFVIYNVTATAGAVTMLYDDFFVGPQVSSSGFAGTDWVAYTPTFVGLGTPTGVTFESRRVGDTLEVKGLFTSGTVTASTVQIGIGYNGGSGNVVVDTSKISGNTLVGNAGTGAAGATYFDNAILAPPSNASYVQFGQQSSTVNKLSPGTGNNVGTGTNVQLYFAVPIVGWSSNTVQSADTDSRVIAARAMRAAAQSIASGTPTVVQFDTLDFDKSGSMDIVTNKGRYTIPVSGVYPITASVQFGATATGTQRAININKNGSFLCQLATIAPGSAQVVVTGSTDLSLNAGDYIEIAAYQDSGGALNVGGNSQYTYVSIKRLSGTAVVQATESVNGRYTGASATLSGSFSQVTYLTKDFDSHNAYSSGTLTIPVSGKYQLNAGLICGGTWAANQTFQVSIYKNGAEVTQDLIYAGSAVTNMSGGVNDIISCLAGDLITIRAAMGSTSPNVNNATATRNWFSWSRVGN